MCRLDIIGQKSEELAKGGRFFRPPFVFSQVKEDNIMKKRLLALLCAVMMAMGMLVGCGSTETQNTTTAGSADTTTAAKVIDLSGVTLMNEGVLTVGCEVGYPPFEDFADDGKTPIGYDVDIITAVADKLGLELNIVNTAWDGIFEGIDVNYDCVCSAVTITSLRQETMIFSSPYIKNYQAVVLPADADWTVESFMDLDGKTIAVQKETTSDELMSDYKSTGTIDVQIVANEKITSCFTQLLNGEVDAVVVDSTVADGYVAKSSDYVIAYKDQSEAEEFGIAMGKGSTALQAAINAALAELEAEGFIEETYKYWFGESK